MITFDDAVEQALERGESPAEHIRWLLSQPKYCIASECESLQQLLRSCHETYMRVNCGSQIVERR